jgi:acetylornithine/N-succinyldiaminopimelate aminotransferase
MNLFDVYTLFNITPDHAKGSWVYDTQGQRYLDLYGGHAVISIGHSHPHYIEQITAQLRKIGFYSNSVQNPLQVKLAARLGEVSGYPDYSLFLCNSGAEAVENALKLASFTTGKKKVIAFGKSFHGRTSAAVAVTDIPKYTAPVNAGHQVVFVPLNDREAFLKAHDGDTAAVIIEGIQGVGGIRVPEDDFMKFLQDECRKRNTMFIVDEIQSGYGRSGKFFAHQYAGVKPDLITVAKGMGNGFPIAGVLIRPGIESWKGMLGTTFGGNYLACAAALAVLDVMEGEKLVENAAQVGAYWLSELKKLSLFTDVRGRGLMIGVDVPESQKSLRSKLLEDHHIFTGEAGPGVIRFLPSLALSREEADVLLHALKVASAQASFKTVI